MKKVFLIKKLGKKLVELKCGRKVAVEHILVLRITLCGKSSCASQIEVVEQPCNTPRKKCLNEKVLASGSLEEVAPYLPMEKYIAEDKQFSAFCDSLDDFILCTPVLVRFVGQNRHYTLGCLQTYHHATRVLSLAKA